MRSPPFVLALLLACPLSVAAEYARPDLLMEPAELTAALAEGSVVALHASAAPQAIPDSIPVDVARWKAAFGEGTDAAAWSAWIGALGIDADTRVVVYDEGGVTNAARVWWILRYWGVDAALLNGGLRAWVAEGLPVVNKNASATPKAATFVATPQPDRLRTTEQMVALAGDGGARLIDTRSDREVLVSSKLSDETEHCDWVRLVDPATSRFLSADELSEVLELDSGGESRPVVTYCRSGGRASVTAFALELMGVERVANYYGSWNAWERRGTTDVPPPVSSVR